MSLLMQCRECNVVDLRMNFNEEIIEEKKDNHALIKVTCPEHKKHTWKKVLYRPRWCNE